MVSSAGERELFPAFLYVYVAHADASFARALAAGAMTLEEPLDTPNGDRRPWCVIRSATSFTLHTGADRQVVGRDSKPIGLRAHLLINTACSQHVLAALR